MSSSPIGPKRLLAAPSTSDKPAPQNQNLFSSATTTPTISAAALPILFPTQSNTGVVFQSTIVKPLPLAHLSSPQTPPQRFSTPTATTPTSKCSGKSSPLVNASAGSAAGAIKRRTALIQRALNSSGAEESSKSSAPPSPSAKSQSARSPINRSRTSAAAGAPSPFSFASPSPQMTEIDGTSQSSSDTPPMGGRSLTLAQRKPISRFSSVDLTTSDELVIFGSLERERSDSVLEIDLKSISSQSSPNKSTSESSSGSAAAPATPPFRTEESSKHREQQLLVKAAASRVVDAQKAVEQAMQVLKKMEADLKYKQDILAPIQQRETAIANFFKTSSRNKLNEAQLKKHDDIFNREESFFVTDEALAQGVVTFSFTPLKLMMFLYEKLQKSNLFVSCNLDLDFLNQSIKENAISLKVTITSPNPLIIIAAVEEYIKMMVLHYADRCKELYSKIPHANPDVLVIKINTITIEFSPQIGNIPTLKDH